MNKKYYLVGVIILVVIAAIIFFTSKGNKAVAPENIDMTNQNEQSNNETDIPEPTNETTATNTLPETTSALAVSTQIAGSEVTIDNFFLEEPGFIVIHSQSNNGLGEILGRSGYLGAGNGQDLLISATIEAGTNYLAVIYSDDGSRTFNNEDSPLLQPDGDPVSVQFQVGN